MQCSFSERSQLDSHLMQLALDQAQKGSLNNEIPVGAIFAQIEEDKNGLFTYEIVVQSHNLTNETKNASMHCEIVCLNQLEQQGLLQIVNNLSLYVTIEPCIMCGYALNIANIKEVFYGASNDKFGGNGSVIDTSQMIPHPYKQTSGIMKEQTINVLKEFYESGNQNIDESMRQRKKVKTE